MPNSQSQIFNFIPGALLVALSPTLFCVFCAFSRPKNRLWKSYCKKSPFRYISCHDSNSKNRTVGFFWSRDSGPALNSFGYLRDRLFQVCCFLYALNRWGLKPRVHNYFLQRYFNDVLLIPCALPVLLFLERQLHLRDHDSPPTAGEIAGNVILWFVLFEVLGPYINPLRTGDPLKLGIYAAGGTLAWLWWHRERLFRRTAAHEL